MNKNIIEKWSLAAFDLAKEIKPDNSPSIYAYMVISSSTIIDLFFTAIDSIKPDDFPFSTKKQYIENLKKLKPKEIKALYVFFLLDYFPFIKLDMDEKFLDVFPIKYDDLVSDFKKAFKGYQTEIKQLELTFDEYEKPFHSRTFLKRTGLPKNQDDIFLIHTLNELKFELFHQFNKNISRLIKAQKG